jgi:hypothetical protein
MIFIGVFYILTVTNVFFVPNFRFNVFELPMSFLFPELSFFILFPIKKYEKQK